MKNINAILADLEIEIPEEKLESFNKEFSANYKTIAEVNKIIAKSDAYKDRAEQAEESMKKFEGMDPAKIQEEIEVYKKKAEDAEKEFNTKLAERDYNDAMAKALGEYKFSSNAARISVESQVRDAKLTMRDGKILGLADLMESIKAEDASAFAEDAGDKPKFTGKSKPAGTSMTKEQIMSIKDATERQAAIQQNIELFQ